jgi:hypothetical protein
MNARTFALYGGIVFLAIGFLSFIPGLEGTYDNLIRLDMNVSYARFLGLFPMNLYNKGALMTFGIVGIMVSREEKIIHCIHFAKAVFIAMVPLAILGLIPATQTLFGQWPLYGAEAGAHAFFGLLGGYFGFIENRSQRTV